MERWITDNEPSVRYPTYTRANAGEVMPDPVSPLTASMGIMAAGEAGWRDAYSRLGTFQPDEFEDDRPNTIGCFGGYLYLNMSLTRIYGVRCPGMSPEIVDFTYFGEMPGIPPYEEERRPTDESPDGTARLAEWLQWIMTADDLPELLDDQAEVEEVIARRPDLAADCSPGTSRSRGRPAWQSARWPASARPSATRRSPCGWSARRAASTRRRRRTRCGT